MTASLFSKHNLFYRSCIVASFALVGFAILESQPNILDNIMHSVRLIDAIIFAAFGVWSRTGKSIAPAIMLIYSLFLIFEPKLIDSPFRYVAIGIYISVMITAILSLYESWCASIPAAPTAEQEETK